MHTQNFLRRFSRTFGLAACLGATLIAIPSRASGPVAADDKSAASAPLDPGEYEIVVRLIPFELTKFDSWQLKNHNGQDVLDMIRKLHPNQLNRFFTPRPTWTAMVPMGDGKPELPIADYLTAVNKVCGKDCVLTPKVPLNRDTIWSDQYLYDSLKTTLAMKVTPPVRILDLDNWFNRPGDYKAQLQGFKDMGWKELGFNFTGSGSVDMPMYNNLGDYGMAAVHPGDWSVATGQLALMRKEGVHSILAAIDYPRAIAAFSKEPPDKQADVIERISKGQIAGSYRFIYPIIYGVYDATAQVTSKDGPYHGKTVFDVIVECINRDRVEAKAAGLKFKK